MPPRYRVDLKDTTGTVVATFDSFRSLQFNRVINAPGDYRFEINGLDDRVSLFTTDCQLEVWRTVPDAGIRWYLEFEALHRTEHRYQTQEGAERFVSYGRGYNDLIKRRTIMYPPGSAGADKTGAGETVVKEYVEENAGPGATTPPRLLRSGVIPGFTVQADTGDANSWSGSRAYKNLLDVLQEIGHCVGGLDFFVVGTGGYSYIFQTRHPQWGDNRSQVGLVAATGLNAFGFSPVVFSVLYGNMLVPQYAVSHIEEKNRVFVLGQGIAADRAIRVVEDVVAQAISPPAVTEVVYNATQESTNTGLDIAGLAQLHELEASHTFSFQILQTEASRYARDYFLGDIVTAVYRDQSVDRKITEVGVVVDGDSGREVLTIKVTEVEGH